MESRAHCAAEPAQGSTVAAAAATDCYHADIVLQSLHRAPLWLLLLLLQTVIMQTVSDKLSKVELRNTELG